MLAVEDIFVVIGPDKKIIEIGLSTLLHYFIKYFEKNYETVQKLDETSAKQLCQQN